MGRASAVVGMLEDAKSLTTGLSASGTHPAFAQRSLSMPVDISPSKEHGYLGVSTAGWDEASEAADGLGGTVTLPAGASLAAVPGIAETPGGLGRQGTAAQLAPSDSVSAVNVLPSGAATRGSSVVGSAASVVTASAANAAAGPPPARKSANTRKSAAADALRAKAAGGVTVPAGHHGHGITSHTVGNLGNVKDYHSRNKDMHRIKSMRRRTPRYDHIAVQQNEAIMQGLERNFGIQMQTQQQQAQMLTALQAQTQSLELLVESWLSRGGEGEGKCSVARGDWAVAGWRWCWGARVLRVRLWVRVTRLGGRTHDE